MNIVFMGSPDFAVASLHALLEAKYPVKLVVSQPDKPANRGQQMTPCAVAKYARENNLKLAQPTTLKNNKEILDELKTAQPDVIVVVAYGKILPKEIIQLPKFGCINVHSSLLPKYRGAAPINWAIINGERTTGVTTMFMNEKMDEGDILLQCATEIMPYDTAQDLHDHLAIMGAELLVKTLARLEKENLEGIAQDHSKATYCPKMTKEDGKISWEKSAQSIYNQIRGMNPWPGAYVEQFKIFDAAVIEKDTKNKPGVVVSLDKGIMVQTGFGQLCILEVQAPGKKRMPAIEYLKGHKIKIGSKL